MTLREATSMGAARLLSADAGRDAQFLLLHTLALPATILYLEPEREIKAAELAAYEAAIARRAAGEPIQYITGQQEFYGLMLKVSPAVLIPRPETELLVEALLGRLARDRAVSLIDVGTGSGAIAIALACNLPASRVTAVDMSEPALSLAKQNAAAHRVVERVRFLHSDLLKSVVGEKFDVVVSNPPYVPEADRELLEAQVREHEPELALFAGIDGLDVYKRLVPQAWEALRPGGLLAMEIGFGQQSALTSLLRDWDEVQFLDDLQGIARVVLARRRLRDSGAVQIAPETREESGVP